MDLGKNNSSACGRTCYFFIRKIGAKRIQPKAEAVSRRWVAPAVGLEYRFSMRGHKALSECFIPIFPHRLVSIVLKHSRYLRRIPFIRNFKLLQRIIPHCIATRVGT